MTKNVLVIYKTKYGASHRCAKIIASELNAEMMDLSQLQSLDELNEYSTVIFGGGIYAGTINGANRLSPLLNRLCQAKKNVFVFSVGNTPLERHDILENVRDKSIQEPARSKIIFYHFVARANFSTLNKSDRFILAIRRVMLFMKHKRKLSDGEKLFLKTYGKDTQVIDNMAVQKAAQSIIRHCT